MQKINELSLEDRPREKLIQHGAPTLSDAELLAIIINSGSKGISALDCSRELIKTFGSLADISGSDISSFSRIKGLGKVKASKILASFELAKRLMVKPFEDKLKFLSPETIASKYIPRFLGLKNEEFLVLVLNSSNQLLREITVSKGSLNQTIVHPREVFKVAISESANSIVLIHNHPSGNPQASKEDINITKRLVESGKIIGINVVDHIIIAGDKFTSMLSEGYI